VAKPNPNWQFRDLNLQFRKPKPRPTLKGDARVAAWKAMSVESKGALARFRSMAGIKRDVAPHSWEDLRTSTVGPRASFERGATKGS
jgi:hypothetical protein